MKIKFDADQEYQLEAVRSVVDLFDGQPLAAGPHEVRLSATRGDLFTDTGVANRLLIHDEQILESVRTVQGRSGIPVTDELAGLNFSVEMETGTGKTYVYLRTIYELRRRYGFRKFIVVVPSVAIREGVLKNIELTRDHFADLYGKVPVDSWIYDSREVSRLRQFANSNQLQVLILNIDGFNKKDIAVIHRENDRLSGRRPIEFIQATNPIVVIDEPQNMESETARAAITSLNPLCTLRYSATHRNPYNLVHRLDPVQAYDLGLVKRIEVDSVRDEGDFNRPYVRVRRVNATKSRIAARVEIDVRQKDGARRKTITVTAGDDLVAKSGERSLYEGYVVDEIDAGRGHVSFANGIVLKEGETQGSYTDDLMRLQVEETVKEHCEKELVILDQLSGQKLKVLSLFFIDRVANYAAEDGKIRRWFLEAYEERAAQSRYARLRLPPVSDVHNGYFAESKGIPKDTSGSTRADDEAYALIMRDKERLLSPEEPLRFIFSHSALREGWDNPNVFQICTLNETRSELRKRQEIGRGLRLPVMENGERCFDPTVNRLTVVANESYEEFARQLQVEIEDECGVTFDGGRIKNARERRPVRLRKGWQANPDFQELWERIRHRTRYSVEYETKEIVVAAAAALRKMPKIDPPRFRVERVELGFEKEGVTITPRASRQVEATWPSAAVPDLLSYLQRGTELTRATLAEILIQSGRLADASVNPQQFLDQTARAIRMTLETLLIEGIQYEKIAGETYEMRRLKDEKIVGYVSRLVKVKKSIYDAVDYASDVEKRFAEALDTRDDIRLFLKLPSWFKVEKPVGTYNPDWAIVKQPDGEEARLYLVKETKGTKDPRKLRGRAWAKIECGKAHFKVLEVDFDYATSASEV
ncbi:hypothetical protein BH18GEM1_BH18GEM1_16010 [soil metagenome]